MAYSFTKIVAGLPPTVPFVGPETLERQRGAPFEARLGANESGFGPSPAACDAMRAAVGRSWAYADPEHFSLKAALAAHHGVRTDEIIVGEGIDGLLGNLVRLMVEPGVAVVTSDGAYPTFNYHVAGFGGALHLVPYRDDHEDLEALAEAAHRNKARLVYLANPDNPMGTHHDAAAIARFADGLPEGALLILDEAYADFLPEPPLPLQPIRPNVIRFRTFSKAYGMAGARVGYGIGPATLIAAFDRVRNHFGMSLVSIAGAEAALADQAWLTKIRSEVETARGRIGEIAEASGLQPLPSATNFVAVDCGRDGAFARRMVSELANAGVFVRMPMVAPLDRCIRISAAPPDALDILEAAMPRACKACG